MVVINRYYDPATDQFLSIDPLVDQTDQPYVFVNDNPLNGDDPTGLTAVALMGGGPNEGLKPVKGNPGQVSVTYNAPTIYAGTLGEGVAINASVTAVGKSGAFGDVSVNVTGSQVSTSVNGQYTSFQIATAGEGVTTIGSVNIAGNVSFSSDGTTTDTWTYNIHGQEVTVTVAVSPAGANDDIYFDPEAAGVAAGAVAVVGTIAYLAPKAPCILLPPPFDVACAAVVP